jgi:hypothetical protein
VAIVAAYLTLVEIAKRLFDQREDRRAAAIVAASRHPAARHPATRAHAATTDKPVAPGQSSAV